jgi:hypothetical protein
MNAFQKTAALGSALELDLLQPLEKEQRRPGAGCALRRC